MKNVEADFDNPWRWHREHTCLETNITGSGFDVGVDEYGHMLIHHDSAVRTVNRHKLVEMVDEWVEEHTEDTNE